MSCELSAGSAGALGSQVVRGVSGLSKLISGGGASLLNEDGENSSDVLSHGTDFGELDLGSGGDLANSEGSELFLYK